MSCGGCPWLMLIINQKYSLSGDRAFLIFFGLWKLKSVLWCWSRQTGLTKWYTGSAMSKSYKQRVSVLYLMHEINLYSREIQFTLVSGYLQEWPICLTCNNPDSKVHGAYMGPTWGRQDPDGPHVGPLNFAIWEHTCTGTRWRCSSSQELCKAISFLCLPWVGTNCFSLIFRQGQFPRNGHAIIMGPLLQTWINFSPIMDE